MWTKAALLFAGGGTGTLLRYLISVTVNRWFPSSFPWGTLTVNLSGSLLIGFAWGISEQFPLPPAWRLFLVVGLFGGYTTFSAFMVENLHLLNQGELRLALLNLVLANLAGLLLVFAGYFLARSLLSFR